MKKYDSRTGIQEVVNDLDLRIKSIPVPGTSAKLVDYDFDGQRYKLVVEFGRKKHSDFWFNAHSSFSSVIATVQAHSTKNE